MTIGYSLILQTTKFRVQKLKMNRYVKMKVNPLYQIDFDLTSIIISFLHCVRILSWNSTTLATLVMHAWNWNLFRNNRGRGDPAYGQTTIYILRYRFSANIISSFWKNFETSRNQRLKFKLTMEYLNMVLPPVQFSGPAHLYNKKL